MAVKVEHQRIAPGGREVLISKPPAKLLFARALITKLDLARYYVTVAAGALRGAGGAPACSSATRRAAPG